MTDAITIKRATVASCSHLTSGIYFTRFLNSAQGLNVGTLCSGIITVVFLVMFLAVFFALVLTLNVPNPRRYTLFSFASEPLTASMRPSTIACTVVASIPVLFDTSLIIR